MKLFLEHDDPNACRSAWEPDPQDPEDVEAMRELGWQRIPNTPIPDLIVPTNGHADPDAIDDPDDDVRAVPTIRRPCPDHTAPVQGCGRCEEWVGRHEVRA